MEDSQVDEHRFQVWECSLDGTPAADDTLLLEMQRVGETGVLVTAHVKHTSMLDSDVRRLAAWLAEVLK